MRRVSMREANQNFASLVAEVESGEQVILERRGVPVAEIIPFRSSEPVDEAREKRLRELRRRLMKGIPLGGKAPSKAEMHGFD